jgi:hypothetical protein
MLPELWLFAHGLPIRQPEAIAQISKPAQRPVKGFFDSKAMNVNQSLSQKIPFILLVSYSLCSKV